MLLDKSFTQARSQLAFTRHRTQLAVYWNESEFMSFSRLATHLSRTEAFLPEHKGNIASDYEWGHDLE